jgi:uncharacterized membrane protein
MLMAGTVPLFLGGLLSDIAYAQTYEMQWSNFAAWLIAGGMVFTGFALLWAVIDLFRARGRRGRSLMCFLLLLATFALGLINSFVHAWDAWAAMPDGLILSAVVVVLAVLANWFGFSSFRMGGMK